MADKKTLTISLMDPPYETHRTTTAFRIMEIAVRRGYNLNVFAFEGAAALAFAKQQAHANVVHGREAEEENHPRPSVWVSNLMKAAAKSGAKIDWVNCGLCADERGVNEAVEGVRRGTPADLLKFAEGSDNTLVIGTR